MRKLLFTFALLLCSTQVTAQTCSSLSGACLKHTTSGGSEILGPIECYSALPFFFQATVGQDQVTGQCHSGHSTFFRVRNGAVIETFVGSVIPNALSGTVSRPGKAGTLPWSATFANCSNLNFNFSTCGQNCAKTHCPGGKPPCSPCYAKCLAACKNGKTDDPNCED